MNNKYGSFEFGRGGEEAEENQNFFGSTPSNQNFPRQLQNQQNSKSARPRLLNRGLVSPSIFQQSNEVEDNPTKNQSVQESSPGTKKIGHLLKIKMPKEGEKITYEPQKEPQSEILHPSNASSIQTRAFQNAVETNVQITLSTKQQKDIQKSFSSSLESSISSLKEMFAHDFSDILKYPPNCPSFDVSGFIDSLGTDIVQMVRTIEPNNYFDMNITKKINSTIAEVIIPITSELSRSRIRNTLARDKHRNELSKIHEELGYLSKNFKSSCYGILDELEKGRIYFSQLADDKHYKHQKLQQKREALKRKQEELEMKADYLDSDLQENKALIDRMDSISLDGKCNKNQKIIEELSNIVELTKENNFSGFNELFGEQLNILNNEIDDIQSERKEICELNKLMKTKFRISRYGIYEFPSSQESFAIETQKKLHRLKDKREKASQNFSGII